MKRILIGSLVGAIILFVYQGLSWMVLPVHANTYKHTTQQDSIISRLSTQLTDEGVYMVPSPTPGVSHEQAEKEMMARIDKPWATISYHKRFNVNMAVTMVSGFLIDLVSVLIVATLLMRITAMRSYSSRLFFVLLFACFSILQAQLTEYNWLYAPLHYIIGGIIDMFVGWFLCGLWLAWYMGRTLRVVTTP